MCEFPRDEVLKTVDECADVSKEQWDALTCRFMVRPRHRGSLGYHIFPCIDESESYYIVEDNPTLPDCIPMKRYGVKLVALLKEKWERVPRIVWRDVTKEVTEIGVGCLVHAGHLLRLKDDEYEITIKRRVEVEG